MVRLLNVMLAFKIVNTELKCVAIAIHFNSVGMCLYVAKNVSSIIYIYYIYSRYIDIIIIKI